jgi:hypothetical protein
MRARYLDDPDVLRRFWDKVDKSDVNGCWLWTAGVNTYGYGVFRTRRGPIGAHRLALQLVYGQLARNQLALHKCNNPLCVRVHEEHVYIGTYSDNNHDAVLSGNNVGAHNKLSQEQVEHIRQRFAAGGITLTQLATEYGVWYSTISNIVRRKSWRNHI